MNRYDCRWPLVDRCIAYGAYLVCFCFLMGWLK